MHKLQAARTKGPLAYLSDVRLFSGKDVISLDESVTLSLSFRLGGYIRGNFVQSTWEDAYNVHDTGLRVTYRVSLSKIAGGLLTRAVVKPLKFVRSAKFYWSRNPELPHRIWTMIVNEHQIPTLPHSEEEAKSLLFDVHHDFTLNGYELGKGTHRLLGKVEAKWARHIFVEKAKLQAVSKPVKLICH